MDNGIPNRKVTIELINQLWEEDKMLRGGEEGNHGIISAEKKYRILYSEKKK